MLACEQSDIPVIKLLIEKGAKLDSQDKYG
jgi:uncharacterized protein